MFVKLLLGKEIQCGILFHKKPSVLFQANGAFNLTLPAQPVIRFNGVIQEESRNNYKVKKKGTKSIYILNLQLTFIG